MQKHETIDWEKDYSAVNTAISTIADHEVISVSDEEPEEPTTTTTRTKCPVGPRPLVFTINGDAVRKNINEKSMLLEANDHIAEVKYGMAEQRVWLHEMMQQQAELIARFWENGSVVPHWLEYDPTEVFTELYNSDDATTLQHEADSNSEEEEEEGDAYSVRPRPDEDPASLADGEYVPPPLKKQRK